MVANGGRSGCSSAKLVVFLDHLEDAFVAVDDGERGEFDGSHEVAQHFGRVVERSLFGNELLDGGLHVFVVQMEVVLRESLLVFARGGLVVVMFVVVVFVTTVAMF